MPSSSKINIAYYKFNSLADKEKISANQVTLVHQVFNTITYIKQSLTNNTIESNEIIKKSATQEGFIYPPRNQQALNFHIGEFSDPKEACQSLKKFVQQFIDCLDYLLSKGQDDYWIIFFNKIDDASSGNLQGRLQEATKFIDFLRKNKGILKLEDMIKEFYKSLTSSEQLDDTIVNREAVNFFIDYVKTNTYVKYQNKAQLLTFKLIQNYLTTKRAHKTIDFNRKFILANLLERYKSLNKPTEVYQHELIHLKFQTSSAVEHFKTFCVHLLPASMSKRLLAYSTINQDKDQDFSFTLNLKQYKAFFDLTQNQMGEEKKTFIACIQTLLSYDELVKPDRITSGNTKVVFEFDTKEHAAVFKEFSIKIFPEKMANEIKDHNTPNSVSITFTHKQYKEFFLLTCNYNSQIEYDFFIKVIRADELCYAINHFLALTNVIKFNLRFHSDKHTKPYISQSEGVKNYWDKVSGTHNLRKPTSTSYVSTELPIPTAVFGLFKDDRKGKAAGLIMTEGKPTTIKPYDAGTVMPLTFSTSKECENYRNKALNNHALFESLEDMKNFFYDNPEASFSPGTDKIRYNEVLFRTSYHDRSFTDGRIKIGIFNDNRSSRFVALFYAYLLNQIQKMKDTGKPWEALKLTRLDDWETEITLNPIQIQFYVPGCKNHLARYSIKDQFKDIHLVQQAYKNDKNAFITEIIAQESYEILLFLDADSHEINNQQVNNSEPLLCFIINKEYYPIAEVLLLHDSNQTETELNLKKISKPSSQSIEKCILSGASNITCVFTKEFAKKSLFSGQPPTFYNSIISKGQIWFFHLFSGQAGKSFFDWQGAPSAFELCNQAIIRNQLNFFIWLETHHKNRIPNTFVPQLFHRALFYGREKIADWIVKYLEQNNKNLLKSLPNYSEEGLLNHLRTHLIAFPFMDSINEKYIQPMLSNLQSQPNNFNLSYFEALINNETSIVFEGKPKILENYLPFASPVLFYLILKEVDLTKFNIFKNTPYDSSLFQLKDINNRNIFHYLVLAANIYSNTPQLAAQRLKIFKLLLPHFSETKSDFDNFFSYALSHVGINYIEAMLLENKTHKQLCLGSAYLFSEHLYYGVYNGSFDPVYYFLLIIKKLSQSDISSFFRYCVLSDKIRYLNSQKILAEFKTYDVDLQTDIFKKLLPEVAYAWPNQKKYEELSALIVNLFPLLKKIPYFHEKVIYKSFKDMFIQLLYQKDSMAKTKIQYVILLLDDFINYYQSLPQTNAFLKFFQKQADRSQLYISFATELKTYLENPTPERQPQHDQHGNESVYIDLCRFVVAALESLRVPQIEVDHTQTLS